MAKENGSPKGTSQAQHGLSDTLKKRLHQIINSQPVMLFMKGSPEEPQCGFSKKVVEILNKEKVKFGSVVYVVLPCICLELKFEVLNEKSHLG